MDLMRLLGIKKQPRVIVLPKSRPGKNKIRPDNTPLYKVKGWIRINNQLCGYFNSAYGSWAGCIKKKGDKLLVFIVDPPKEKLKLHPKWPCFHEREKNIYEIHLQKQPKDLDVNSVISYIEKIIEDGHKINSGGKL